MLRLKSVLVICENRLLELVSIMGLLTSYGVELKGDIGEYLGYVRKEAP